MSHQFKVLLMEDNHLYCVFLKHYIEDLGYTVAESWSFEESQILLREEQPDAIIFDIGVPAYSAGNNSIYLPLGGLELLDWLYKQENIPKPKLTILISAVLSPTVKDEAKKRGVTAIFEKPFCPSDLVKLLSQAASKIGRD